MELEMEMEMESHSEEFSHEKSIDQDFELSPERTARIRRHLSRKRHIRRAQRCSWKLWPEPDDTNSGPQIIVTDPNGVNNYLIDPETFQAKLQQRRKWLHNETRRKRQHSEQC